MRRTATNKNSHSANIQKHNLPQDQNAIEKKIEYALKALERTDAWINSCDNKLSVLLAFCGVLITISITSESVKSAYDFVFALLANAMNVNTILYLVFVILLLCSCVITFCNIASAIIARVDSRVFSQSEMSNKSNLFFGSITGREYTAFKKSFVGENVQERLNDILSQVYINSAIAQKKFEKYNASLRWLFISGVLFAIVITWGIIGF